MVLLEQLTHSQLEFPGHVCFLFYMLEVWSEKKHQTTVKQKTFMLQATLFNRKLL